MRLEKPVIAKMVNKTVSKVIHTIPEICAGVWDLESRFDLFKWTIQGVKPWIIIRSVIFMDICQKLGLYSPAHTQKNTIRDKLGFFLLSVYNSFTHNPFVGNNQGKIWIFRHPRKICLNGNWVDIYTQPLVDELEPGSYEIFEKPYLNRHHITDGDADIKYLDHMILSNSVKSRFKYVKLVLTDSDIYLIKSLETELHCRFGYQEDLTQLLKIQIARFKLAEAYYCRLIKKKRPRKIVLVVSYCQGALISAAKKYDVEVVELQHGTITPYHMGYSFPSSNNSVPYCPDRIFSFGDYWKDTVALPISKDKIHSLGFPFLSQKLRQYQGSGKKKQIVFISQGTIGKQLSEMAVKAANDLNEFVVIYKLHPGEYDRWKIEYKELNFNQSLKNLQIVGSSDEDFHYLLASSEFQVGVYSTAIFEGLALGCKTILVNLPGVEYMTPLIKKGIVRIVENGAELADEVRNISTPSSFDCDYFFKNYNSGDMKKMLE